MLGFLRSNPRPLSSALLLDAEGHSCGFEPGLSLSVASLTQRQNYLPPCHGAGQIIWVRDAPNLHNHACTPNLACTPISQCPHTAVCLPTPHFGPISTTSPRRQGRRASPTSPRRWPKHPVRRAVISGSLAQPLLGLFICLPRGLFVCSFPAELFSACIQSVGRPALLLDASSLGCDPAGTAWLSWPPPSVP